MDLNAFYELHARLRAGTVAGAALAAEDFRLKRALEALAPLEGAVPVFRKLGDLTRALLTPGCPDRAGALLDALSLADAVAVTQAAVPVPGEVEPIRLLSRGTAVTNAPYSLLAPLLEALTTSGSGKYSYVVETHEQRPELFKDYRVKDALVKALGASYAELANRAAEWLSQEDKSVVPLLKDGFDPQGKKEMARRVEVISALEGAGATPWLLEVLPEAKKDVRAAVLIALGEDPGNAALLLDLAKTERSGSRSAVLKALSRQEGDAVRAFWAEELDKNPASILCLWDTETQWSGDLIAAGLRARLEKMLTKGDRIAGEENENFSRWCQAVGKKASPAMLDFWRWADGHMETFDRFTNEKGNPVFVGVRLTDTLRECLCRTGPGPLRDLCLELFDRRPSMTRYLHISFHAALLTRPAAEVYEKFSPYILTKKPLLNAERKETCNYVLLRALRDVLWDRDQGRYVLTGGRPLAEPLDKRWIRRLILAACKPDGGKYYPFGGGDTVDQFDKTLMDLSNPADPEQRTWLVPYLRQRMVETGSWYSYGNYLLRFGGSLKGVLGESMKKCKYAQLYNVWLLLNEASKSFPAGEIADLCQEALDTERFRLTGDELYRAKKALPWTIEQLRAGEPFPEWDVWWKMRR